MACPHHHRYAHTQTPSNQCCRRSCCCSSSFYSSDYCCCCCCSNTSPLTTSGHLSQTLAAQILLQHSPQLMPSLYSKLQQQPPQAPLFPGLHHGEESRLPPHHLHDHQQQPHPLVQSLLCRIAALESSFSHVPPSHSSPSPSPAMERPSTRHFSPSPRSNFYCAPSLRDLAARRIQAAFRRFLLRRSQTLRHLKELAAMKSHVVDLRSALSDKTRVDPKALTERVMNLLFRLDAIQGGDSMIREGKRSISRELTRILDFIDKVLVKEHQLFLNAVEFAGNGRNLVTFAEDSRRGSEGAEEVHRAVKKVSFSEVGKRSRVPFSNHDQFVDEISNFSDQHPVVENLSCEAVGNGQGNHTGAERFHEASDDERSSESSFENGERFESVKQAKNQNGKFGLSAPLPVQMESRRN
ncbi:uncharacterized protein LOC121984844 [Zingiber officinale]|nr:uncharacterized protein LOC121984844 [Zingiber officinale]